MAQEIKETKFIAETQEKKFITDIIEKIRSAQYEALKAVNVELINLYWELGKSISEKQADGWGRAIVPNYLRNYKRNSTA